MTDFEPIYVRLQERLATIGALLSVSRRFKHWSSVSPTEMPCAFIVQQGEAPQQVRGQPAKWLISADVFVYVRADDDAEVAPSTAINSALAGVRSILTANPATGVAEGFEGMVSHAWISGKVEIFDGVMASQSVAIIPIGILTA